MSEQKSERSPLEELIEQEAKEKYPIHFSNKDSDENFQVNLRRDAYKAGAMRADELKDKEIEDRNNYYEDKIEMLIRIGEGKDKRIVELEEGLRELMEGVAGLPPLTAIAGTLEKQYSKATQLLNKGIKQ